jgi:hypothetical protein
VNGKKTHVPKDNEQEVEEGWRTVRWLKR